MRLWRHERSGGHLPRHINNNNEKKGQTMNTVTNEQLSTATAAMKNCERPDAYRRFYSYGFLRLSKLQPANGGDRYLQIGSFAGPDAGSEADELERRDRAGEHRHPYDRTEK